MYYRMNVEHICELNAKQLVDFCKLIDKYPTKIIKVEHLEKYIFENYDEKYKDYYFSLIERYNMKTLMNIIMAFY